MLNNYKNKRMQDPQHKQNEDNIDKIKKLEKLNRKLWEFILEKVDDVSELKEWYDNEII